MIRHSTYETMYLTSACRRRRTPVGEKDTGHNQKRPQEQGGRYRFTEHEKRQDNRADGNKVDEQAGLGGADFLYPVIIPNKTGHRAEEPQVKDAEPVDGPITAQVGQQAFTAGRQE